MSATTGRQAATPMLAPGAARLHRIVFSAFAACLTAGAFWLGSVVSGPWWLALPVLVACSWLSLGTAIACLVTALSAGDTAQSWRPRKMARWERAVWAAQRRMIWHPGRRP
jgi:formate-dependent nitrite reductase membrane component NrfD